MVQYTKGGRNRTLINSFEDYCFTTKLHPSEVKGIEPLTMTLEIIVLPLNYTPLKIFYFLNGYIDFPFPADDKKTHELTAPPV